MEPLCLKAWCQVDLFIFFTDSIDILDASLDGKETFHATQVTAWQRGPPLDTDTFHNLKPSQKTLTVPDALTTTLPPGNIIRSPEPKFHSNVQMHWYSESEEPDPHKVLAEAKDLAFIIKRNDEDLKLGWTPYNQERSPTDPPTTTAGLTPIIVSPAHEYHTLNTVVIRCKHVATFLGQQYVILTVDEALYSRLMELKWSQGYSFLIPRLGSLHTAMNFMKAGQYFEASGLADLWTESELLGPKTTERVLAGKDYEKGIQAHKVTPSYVGYSP